MTSLSPLPSVPPAFAGPVATEPRVEAVARQFEALVADLLLKSADQATLGDSLLSGDATTRELVNRQRAEAIARAAPFGIARLLRQERP